MTLGGGNTNTGSNYDEKYAITFRRGAKEESPFFKVVKYFPERQELDNVNKITGKLKGVLHNDEKTISKRDGGTADLPASFTIVLESGTSVYYVSIDYNAGAQMRATLNSILSAEVGDMVELYTKKTISKTNGKEYKVVNVSNPNVQKEITYKDRKTGEDKKATVNESFAWKYSNNEIPDIDVVRDGDEILKVKDENANAFFKEKIKEKFSSQAPSSEASGEIDVDNIPF